jgi:hypothetical protein
MLRRILIGLAAAIAVLALIIATRPSRLHIERSITSAAPPEGVFERVNDSGLAALKGQAESASTASAAGQAPR